ncbi:PIN domain-containing protein [Paenibacillus wenxiniae]|uniref:PIN domain-containing protein n=1 Tax=Paenibacillus wenxiniae TaxID=1636843 RepID=A0ABW4RIC1_9BACL
MSKKKIEIWIDTNVIIYVLRTNKDFSPSARALVQKAGEGMFTLKISPLIISECVFVLMGKQFSVKKEEIKNTLISFINLKGIECEEKKVIEAALKNFSQKGIDFTDAYLAAHAKAVTPANIVTVNIRDVKNLDVFAQTPAEILQEIEEVVIEEN